MVTEPVEGGAPTMSSAAQLGGTRHLSAAQFVHDQRDAIALVASQDGASRSSRGRRARRCVHAHRVEVAAALSPHNMLRDARRR